MLKPHFVYDDLCGEYLLLQPDMATSGHMGIYLHLGVIPEKLTVVLNIVEVPPPGAVSVTPLREVLKNLITKE